MFNGYLDDPRIFAESFQCIIQEYRINRFAPFLKKKNEFRCKYIRSAFVKRFCQSKKLPGFFRRSCQRSLQKIGNHIVSTVLQIKIIPMRMKGLITCQDRCRIISGNICTEKKKCCNRCVDIFPQRNREFFQCRHIPFRQCRQCIKIITAQHAAGAGVRLIIFAEFCYLFRFFEQTIYFSRLYSNRLIVIFFQIFFKNFQRLSEGPEVCVKSA